MTALPPAWKLRREIGRVGGQLSRGVARLYEPALDRIHLHRLARVIRQTEGHRTAGAKIAVFVLFQRPRVAGSIFFTCRHLIANGYAPLIVNNAPLHPEDRARLAEVAWRVVERPNHGYDFGAYRDGLRLIGEAGLAPAAVILMNDSTWFPLSSEDTSLATLDARDAPFSGLSWKHEPATRRGQPHMESHFLRFSLVALRDPAFLGFWTDYVPSASRVSTIERGEKGITLAMLGASFTPEAPLTRHALLNRLETATPRQLLAVLAEADLGAESDRRRVRDLVAVHEDRETWAAAARTLMAELTDSFSNILSGPFVAATARFLGLPFLKKSGEIRFSLARRRVLSLVVAGEHPPLPPEILSELRAVVVQEETSP